MGYMITSDNIKIYYKVKGKGVPIIFIHGFSEDHYCFRIQEKALSKKYKIITYDLRGHGESDRADIGLNLERFALDLRELIEYLQLKTVNLVGWSMGSSIIFEYINKFGTEKLEKICIIDLKLIKDNWIEFAEKFIKIMAPYFNETQFNIARERMKVNTSTVMYSMWKSMIQKDYRPTLKEINISTLILFGEHQRVNFYIISLKCSILVLFKLFTSSWFYHNLIHS